METWINQTLKFSTHTQTHTHTHTHTHIYIYILNINYNINYFDTKNYINYFNKSPFFKSQYRRKQYKKTKIIKDLSTTSDDGHDNQK